MERRTTVGVAAGVTLAVASIAVAIGLNAALVSDRTATTGPGTFEPAAETRVPSPAEAATTTTAAAPTAAAPTTRPRHDDRDDDRGDDRGDDDGGNARGDDDDD